MSNSSFSKMCGHRFEEQSARSVSEKQIFLKMLSFHPAFQPLPCFPSYPPTLSSQQSSPSSLSSALFLSLLLKHASSCSMFAWLLHLHLWCLAVAHIRSSVTVKQQWKGRTSRCQAVFVCEVIHSTINEYIAMRKTNII